MSKKRQGRPSTESPRRAALIELADIVKVARFEAWSKKTASLHPELRELAALGVKLAGAAQRADDAVKKADESEDDES